MGFNTLAILFQSSVSEFTAMLVLHHGNSLYQMIQLFFVIILTSIFNGTVLAQLKPPITMKKAPAKGTFDFYHGLSPKSLKNFPVGPSLPIIAYLTIGSAASSTVLYPV